MQRKSKRSISKRRKTMRGGCGCGVSQTSSIFKGGSNFGPASIDTNTIGLESQIPNYGINTYSNDPLHMSISARNVPNDFFKGGKKRRSRKQKKRMRKNRSIRYRKIGGTSLISTFSPIPIGGLFGSQQVNPNANVQPVINITDSNPQMI